MTNKQYSMNNLRKNQGYQREMINESMPINTPPSYRTQCSRETSNSLLIISQIILRFLLVKNSFEMTL